MPHALRVLVLTMSLLAASAGAALACSCVRYPTPEAHVAATDVIFIGTVERIERLPGARHAMRTTFHVTETLKGDLSEHVTVRHSEDVCCICGIAFERGARVMIFAHRGEDGLSTSSCSAARFEEADYRAALQRHAQ